MQERWRSVGDAGEAVGCCDRDTVVLLGARDSSIHLHPNSSPQ